MTVILEKQYMGNYYVTIEQEKFSSSYKVVKYYMDRKRDERCYPTLKQAKRRFRDVLKKCEEKLLDEYKW